MKTNLFRTSAFFIGLSASLSACGGAGGDGTITRGGLSNITWDQIEWVNPSPDASQAVCPNFQVQIKLPGTLTCDHVDMNTVVAVYPQGGSMTNRAYFASTEVNPLPAEGKCQMTGVLRDQLAPGVPYIAKAFSDIGSGLNLLTESRTFNTYDAQTAAQHCALGSFTVQYINGTNDFFQSTMEDFLILQSDGSYRPGSFTELASSISSAGAGWLFNYLLGLGDIPRIEPSGRHRFHIQFTDRVNDYSIVDFGVYNFGEQGSGSISSAFQRNLNVQVVQETCANPNAVPGSCYVVKPYDPDCQGDPYCTAHPDHDYGWDPDRTYLIFIKRSVSSSGGVRMPMSIVKLFHTTF